MLNKQFLIHLRKGCPPHLFNVIILHRWYIMTVHIHHMCSAENTKNKLQKPAVVDVEASQPFRPEPS